MDTISKNMKIITDAMFEIRDENIVIGEVLLNSFDNSLKILDAMKDGGKVDISDKIKFISELVGFSVEDLILDVIQKNQISPDEVDNEAIDFILNNSDINNDKDSNKYEEFLETNIKDNMEFLKKEL